MLCMKTGRPKLKLAIEPELLTEVETLYRKTKDVRVKERAQAILLAVDGDHSYEQIAKAVGRARSAIQRWITAFEQDGVSALYSRQGQGGGRPSPMNNAELQVAFEQKLKEGAWRTAAEAKEWLHTEMGIEQSVSNVYYWMGKLAGALKMPRPVHIKKDPAEAELFKAHLYDRLRELNIEAGKRVKIWVQDEARYGLHSAHRRCWGLKGVRVVKPSQQKFKWGYVYGALEVVEGGGQFCYLPTVNLGNTQLFLEQIAGSDPDAEHVIIWDGAGFHHRPCDPRLPNNLHLVPLPAYSPELNPIEKLWDVAKDQICNRVFETLDAIEEKLTEALRPYWEQPLYARSLVGDGWLHTQANATLVNFIPFSF